MTPSQPDFPSYQTYSPDQSYQAFPAAPTYQTTPTYLYQNNVPAGEYQPAYQYQSSCQGYGLVMRIVKRRRGCDP